MKKWRDSFKITLIGSQHTYHHPCSQNNILLDVFQVCKLQKRAEQFMELFNVFELKILGYNLEFSVPPENFFSLL